MSVGLGKEWIGSLIDSQLVLLVVVTLRRALLSQLFGRRFDDTVADPKRILKTLGGNIDLGWWLASNCYGLLALHGQLTALLSRLLHRVSGATSCRSASSRTRSSPDTSLEKHARIRQQGGLLQGLLLVELHGARSKQGSVFPESED